MQRGGVKSGGGGLFSWFSSPGIKGSGRGEGGAGDGGAGGGGSNGMGDGAVAGKNGSGTGAWTGSGDGGSGSALVTGQPIIRGEFPSASTGGHPGATRW